MADPVQIAPYAGTLVADLTALGGKLIDLPPGGMVGLRREQPGMADVVTELETAAPTLPAVKVHYDEFVEHTKTLAQIRAGRAIVDKLAEVLAETEAKLEHERENALAMIVDAVKSAAKRKGGTGALALFEKSIHYLAQAGLRAAETRRRNAEAKKGDGAKPSGG
jgi:hypothetical protein